MRISRTPTLITAALAALGAASLVAGCGSSEPAPADAATTRAASAAGTVDTTLTITNKLPIDITVTSRPLSIRGQVQPTPWKPDASPGSGPAALANTAVPAGSSVQRDFVATNFGPPQCRADVVSGKDYQNPLRANFFTDIGDASGRRTLFFADRDPDEDPRPFQVALEMGYAKAPSGARAGCPGDAVVVAAGWGEGRSKDADVARMCPTEKVEPKFLEFTFVKADGTQGLGTFSVRCGMGQQSAVLTLSPASG